MNIILKHDIGGKESGLRNVEVGDVDKDEIGTGTLFECGETGQRFIYCNCGENKAALILWGLGEIKEIKAGTVLKQLIINNV